MWIARVYLLCLAVLLVAVTAAHGAMLPRVRRHPLGKLCLGLVTICATLGLVLGQLNLYTALTGQPRPQDSDIFVFVVLLGQCITAIAILFMFAWRERNALRNTE